MQRHGAGPRAVDDLARRTLPEQQLEEASGPVIELRVLSSDGYGQATAYLYVSASGVISSS